MLSCAIRIVIQVSRTCRLPWAYLLFRMRHLVGTGLNPRLWAWATQLAETRRREGQYNRVRHPFLGRPVFTSCWQQLVHPECWVRWQMRGPSAMCWAPVDGFNWVARAFQLGFALAPMQAGWTLGGFGLTSGRSSVALGRHHFLPLTGREIRPQLLEECRGKL